jgi:hypothetical protein
MHSYEAISREFVAAVHKASRGGQLKIETLLTSYLGLAPSFHTHLAHSRKVDVKAIVGALLAMPECVAQVSQVLLVPDLNAYPHLRPDLNSQIKAGRLDESCVLLEVKPDEGALIDLACQLCLLQFEMTKSRELLKLSLNTQEEPELAEDPSKREPSGTLDAEQEEHEQEEHEQKDEDHDADSESVLSKDDNDSAESVLMRLAFDWGTDVNSLAEAQSLSEGVFLDLFVGKQVLPEVFIHPDLSFDTMLGTRRGCADRIVEKLAEMGFLRRPIHVWVGDRGIIDCLSPYTRDLRDTLITWATNTPQNLDENTLAHLQNTGPQITEDLLYAISNAFIGDDTRLVDERRAAERQVGIIHFQVDDLCFEAVDLGRIDPNHCDARLHHWHIEHDAPILLRLPSLSEGNHPHLMDRLFELIGAGLHSITMLFDEGESLSTTPGIKLPKLWIAWEGEEKYPLPVLSSFDLECLSTYQSYPAQSGNVWALPTAKVFQQGQFERLGHDYDVSSSVIGGEKMLRLFYDHHWAQRFRSDLRFGCCVLGPPLHEGMVDSSRQQNIAAIALATLRKLVAPMDDARRTSEDELRDEDLRQPEQPTKPAISRRTILLKA